MIYRKLGKSDLEVSLLGFGTWATSKTGWKDVNQNEAIQTLESSYEYGINFYDTAPIYGFGKAEEIIGNSFSSIRNKIIIATKFGLEFNEFGKVKHNLSKDFIKREIENSLARLKTDYIDLYQVHWPTKAMNQEEVFSTLEEYINQKVIRYVGVSNYNIFDLEQANKTCNISSIQNCYNLLQTDPENDILDFCKDNQIGFIAYSPLAQGLLSGKVTRDYKMSKNDIRRFNPLFKEKDIFDKIDKLEKPLVKTAYKYLMKQEVVSSVLTSMTKIKHLQNNIKIIDEIFS